jgi:hypothetical protein
MFVVLIDIQSSFGKSKKVKAELIERSSVFTAVGVFILYSVNLYEFY